MEANKKISVIIPVYNVEKYVAECLDSVLKNQFEDMEIICIDDGSTDRSIGILEDYCKRDKRIKIYRNDRNRGLSYTRNRGMELAVGEYLYFLDSDDMIEDNTLCELYRCAIKNQVDGILFGGRIIYDDNKFYSLRGFEQRKGNYKGVYTGKALFEALIDNGEWISCVPLQFWKREFLSSHNLRFENGILHEDVLFSVQAVLESERIICRNEAYFIRRYRENSIMTRERSLQHIQGFFCAVEKAQKYILERHMLDQPAVRRWLKDAYDLLMRMLQGHEEWLEQISSQYDEGKIVLLLLKRSVENENLVPIELLQDKVYIYGAGKFGKKVLCECIKKDIEVKGFVVTRRADNVENIAGIKVYLIDEIELADNESVLIAVKDNKTKGEIRRLLEEKGICKVADMREYI